MKKSFLFLFLLMVSLVLGQQVQWATKLIKYSSDLGGKQYGIKKILGKPDAFPQAGNSPNAWNPKKALDGYEIVEVGFEKPQSVKQVAVFENLNSGCVVKIGVDTGDGKYKTVWTRKLDYRTPTFKATIPADHAYYFKRKRRKIYEAPNVLNPGIEHAILDYAVANVVAVKIEFNFALLPGQKQVDAIGISDSEAFIEATINEGEPFKNLTATSFGPLSKFQVYNLSISKDGSKMFFSHQTDEKELVYSAKKNSDGNWSTPQVEPTLSESDSYNYVDFVSDETVIKGGNFYQKMSGETGYHFYKCEMGSYTKKEPVKIAAYANYGDAVFVTATADMSVLIMGVESDFSQGGTDLYFTTRKADGTYSLLQNMGKTINSADEEIAPNLLSDGRTLLFASRGYSSFGDYDIFVSHRLDDSWKNWSEPVNLGKGINTVGYDSAPFYDETSETLYLASEYEGKSSLRFAKIAKQILMKFQ